MGFDVMHGPTTPTGESAQWPRWRVRAIRIWYGLLSLWALSMAQRAARMGQAGPGEHFG
jgi:hypothetical protein